MFELCSATFKIDPLVCITKCRFSLNDRILSFSFPFLILLVFKTWNLNGFHSAKRYDIELMEKCMYLFWIKIIFILSFCLSKA